jgi:YVTN family beta-propeller protein
MTLSDLARRSVLGCIVGSCCLLSAGGADATHLAFVTDMGDSTVSVVDLDLAREVQTIAVGPAPIGMALHLGRTPLIATANSKARNVTLIDPVRREALPQTVQTGNGPEDVAFSADGHQLAATSYFEKSVTFSDVASHALLGDPITFDDKIPRHLLMSSDGSELYVLLHDQEGAVAVVDYVSRKVVKTIPIGPFPIDFALAANGSYLLVACFDAQTVTRVDLRTRTVADTFHVDTGAGIAAHPTRPVLYSMLNFDGAIIAFDYAEHKALATIDVGGAPAHGVVTPDGRFLYAANSDGNNLAQIDTATNAAVVRIAVGADPQSVVLFDTSEASLGWLWPLVGGVAVLAVVGVVVWRRRSA